MRPPARLAPAEDGRLAPTVGDLVELRGEPDPEPDLGRVERLLTLAWRSGGQPASS